MLTDSPPRKANRAEFLESDRIKTLDLPHDGHLPRIAQSIESAMRAGATADVRRACAEFLGAASEFYKVSQCGIRVLAARPLRMRENWSTELFGDYDPKTMLIRLWMRTAVRKEITSYKAAVLGTCSRRALADRLAEDESGCMTSAYIPTLPHRIHGLRRILSAF